MSGSSSDEEVDSPNEITVRVATEADIPVMVKLLGVLFRIESDFYPDAIKQKRGLSLLLASPAARAWVAEHPKVGVIGMLTMQTVVSTAEGDYAGLIEDLIVEESFRRCGIGTLLVRAALQYAREKHLPRIQLLADVHNVPAIIFYRDLGWEQTNLMTLRIRLP
jgi:ribosomal protein S18 acetylase RimI-like enzyme